VFKDVRRCAETTAWPGLRHRFASRAYRGSRNLRDVQVLMGHSSIATTERYLAVDDDEVCAAMLAAL
jgi:integrase/recombinase XerC